MSRSEGPGLLTLKAVPGTSLQGVEGEGLWKEVSACKHPVSTSTNKTSPLFSPVLTSLVPTWRYVSLGGEAFDAEMNKGRRPV